MRHIVTVTGASDMGKDSLVDAILYLHGGKSVDELHGVSGNVRYFQARGDFVVREIISHTTRAPRAGEVDGKDYYYVSDAVFDSLQKVEHTEYAGKRYCIAASELEKVLDGSIGIVIVDPHGVQCLKEFCAQHADFQLTSIFLEGSEGISQSRMQQRGDSMKRIEERLVQQMERDEYSPHYNGIRPLLLQSGNEQDFWNNIWKVEDLLQRLVRE